MARLTVNQYRNAISDLIGSFRWQPTWGDKRGLKGEYFKGRNPGSRNRVLERIDPQVVFDFGTTAPHEKLEAHEFSLRWSGSLLVPVTGEFEFVVRTEHAARLWINDTRTPLIDAWVKSGYDKEYRGKCFLTAGRMVPVRLEYTKAKQGVDDSKKNKDKKPAQASSIALLWQLPHRPVEPIPARNLSPNPSPESFTCTAPFPPDDRSYGWERGTTVSREWDQATTEAALEAATYIQDHLQELAGSDKAEKDRQEKWLDFCRKFAERAFRRPLSPDHEKLIERLVRTAKDPETGI
ncbi:MAG: PA14 domain-containing protein, partial [Gemmataceae bacterium]